MASVDLPGVPGQCPLCQHPPIRHVSDGTGYTCLVCAFLAEEYKRHPELYWGKIHPVCTLKFEFKLSRREREQAMAAYKATFPPHTVCAECYCIWQAHHGMLCPTGDSTFLPLLDKDLPFIHTH